MRIVEKLLYRLSEVRLNIVPVDLDLEELCEKATVHALVPKTKTFNASSGNSVGGASITSHLGVMKDKDGDNASVVIMKFVNTQPGQALVVDHKHIRGMATEMAKNALTTAKRAPHDVGAVVITSNLDQAEEMRVMRNVLKSFGRVTHTRLRKSHEQRGQQFYVMG